MNNSSSIYDVAIIGAGPVGLATAIALYRQGITNILVIDQTQEFRPVGQGLDLLPNGLKAIRYIDEPTYQEIRQAHVTSNPNPPTHSSPTKGLWQHRNLEGEIVRSTPLNFDFWTEKYGEGRASLQWFSVQTILRNHLPPELIQIGCRCCDLHQDDSFVQLTLLTRNPATNPFAHWQMQKAELEPSAKSSLSSQENNLENSEKCEQTTQFVQAKLVVAADGIHSQIRQILYGQTPLENWANPHYSGFSAIGCFQSKVLPPELYQTLDDRYLQGERIVSVYPVQTEQNNYPTPRIVITRKADGTGQCEVYGCQIR